ncbi:type II toxin-antitoxin system Phd/YefM family antitoxin [Candidatus Manganitrophus noduliformans]|uniref:Antitoxin n=1 Tax=Candidatus Manganitrophus noduliformans TaxID=2606439 RepID=A0A7X6DUT7_9BACT|nr:type II toxin-antitoxin system Phd/YefM family antitoxin [Candidatus Manganitrophus noduliformans]NKE73627.1 type II toxin-antitoxin system Phd/YefM family antitoxin [Candidatus Manganitrophus noduliformans]
MEQVNIHNAKTHLSQLLERAGSGEEIVIAKAGKPVAKLVSVQPSRKRRKKGLMKGKLKISKAFDKPLPEEIRAAFERETE